MLSRFNNIQTTRAAATLTGAYNTNNTRKHCLTLGGTNANVTGYSNANLLPAYISSFIAYLGTGPICTICIRSGRIIII